MNQLPKKKNINKKRNEKLSRVLTLRDVCPDELCVPLVYAQRNTQSGVVTAEQQFNLNSCFDPDRTGIGHQPLGFDQWSAFYNRYRVDKVDFECDFINGGNTLTDCLVVASNETTAINTVATFESGAEAPFSWNKTVGIASGVGQMRFKRSYYPHLVTGVTREKYRVDDAYSALTSANPTEAIILHVVTQDIGFSTNISIVVRSKLTFHVTFFDRNQLVQS